MENTFRSMTVKKITSNWCALMAIYIYRKYKNLNQEYDQYKN